MRRIQLIEQARHDVTRSYFFTKGKIKELEAIYYRDLDEIRQIVAILDMRQLPDNIQSILQTR